MAPERSPPQLAIEIQRLPAWGGKLMLGLGLSGLSTEGDFGRDTLQTVATTLAGAIQEQRQGAAAKGGKGLGDAYSELARLVHYEHVQVSLEDPEFAAALSKMDADDKVRQDADFTLQDLEGKQWTLKQLGGAGELLGHVVPFVPQGDAGSGKAIPAIQCPGTRHPGHFGRRRRQSEPYIAQGHYTYPILLDVGRIINERFRIQGIPKSLVYGRTGKLVAQSADMRTMDQFLEMMAQAELR